MSFFQNTCRPKGLGGKIMVNMMNAGHASMAEWGFSHIEVGTDAVSLDVGCGGGANVKALLRKSLQGRVTGIDYSEVSVKKSEKVNRAEIAAGRCKILQGDVMQLPFKAETFDLVTAFETIYFWPDIRKAFEQVYCVLKRRGTFMICKESNGESAKDEKWKSVIEGMRTYNSGQLEEALKSAGFSQVRAEENQKNWLCMIAKKG